MNQIFGEIINLFNKNNTYPGEDKCGLSYFFNQEWIYFTLDELVYQRYISDSNNIMKKLYKDFMEDKKNPETLFTENDEHILPLNFTEYNSERNSNNFLKMETNLKSLPDLLIKLGPNIEKIPKNSELTFDDYVQLLKNNFLEIDGAFINDTENIITIEEDSTLTPYEEINVNLIKDKKTQSSEYEASLNLKEQNIIKIPEKAVIFLETKSECPCIKIDYQNEAEFDKTKLMKKEMKKELSVVLYKMIKKAELFYKLYEKLEIVKSRYSVLFFLIFDNFRFHDISEIIKSYLEIFINKKDIITYPFTIKPIYMTSSIDLINSGLSTNNLIKKFEEKIEKLIKEEKKKMKKIKKEKIKREEEEIKRKEEMKKMMIQDSKELKELEEKIKELLNNQSMQNRPTNNKMK